MYSHTEHQRNEMPLLHFWQRSNAVSEFSWFSLDDVCCIVSLYICKNIEQEISQIWQMGGLCLLVLGFCATLSAGFWFQFLYLISSLKSCVWPCIWRALWKFHFGVSAFAKVSGLWGLLRDCVGSLGSNDHVVGLLRSQEAETVYCKMLGFVETSSSLSIVGCFMKQEESK